MGTDCGLHPPTPPPLVCPHPEPGRASPSGEPVGGKLTPVSDDHEAALKSAKKVADLQPLPVYGKPSELGRPWQKCSSAGRAGQNVKMYSSTFLVGWFRPGNYVSRSKRDSNSVHNENERIENHASVITN